MSAMKKFFKELDTSTKSKSGSVSSGSSSSSMNTVGKKKKQPKKGHKKNKLPETTAHCEDVYETFSFDFLQYVEEEDEEEMRKRKEEALGKLEAVVDKALEDIDKTEKPDDVIEEKKLCRPS